MTFQDDLNRMLTDALAESGVKDAGQYTAGIDTTPLLGSQNYGIPYPVETPAITVHRSVAWLPLSLDELVDLGAISEADARAQGWTPWVPPPTPPTPWSRRLRWRWQAWRERAGRKIGGWIAGVDLSERDEDW